MYSSVCISIHTSFLVILCVGETLVARHFLILCSRHCSWHISQKALQVRQIKVLAQAMTLHLISSIIKTTLCGCQCCALLQKLAAMPEVHSHSPTIMLLCKGRPGTETKKKKSYNNKKHKNIHCPAIMLLCKCRPAEAIQDR